MRVKEMQRSDESVLVRSIQANRGPRGGGLVDLTDPDLLVALQGISGCRLDRVWGQGVEHLLARGVALMRWASAQLLRGGWVLSGFPSQMVLDFDSVVAWPRLFQPPKFPLSQTPVSVDAGKYPVKLGVTAVTTGGALSGREQSALHYRGGVAELFSDGSYLSANEQDSLTLRLWVDVCAVPA